MAGPVETLILSPHVDDEVLGCFSFLRQDCFVLYFGVEDRPTAPRHVRLAELAAAARHLGFSFDVLGHCVNHYAAPDLIGIIESTTNRLRPQTVLLPIPSYNQDHRAVYDAGITATRPHDTNWAVSKVLLYEQPDSVLWPHGRIEQPAYFVPIDLESKIAAYRIYASQVRGHRSPDTVRALAVLRGAQIGHPAAEAFVVRRIVGATAPSQTKEVERP